VISAFAESPASEATSVSDDIVDYSSSNADCSNFRVRAFSSTTRVCDAARAAAFTDAEYTSPLAKRPYDLRHAVSTWLNAGVPPTRVAEWAGHSVNVLLRVYAKCVYGQDEVARQRIEAALALTTASEAEADAEGDARASKR
jgi:integrase